MDKNKFSKDELLHFYKLLHLGRLIDEKAPNYLRQAKGWSYHAPYAGHDGIQLALGLTFRANKDFLFPYYRDLLTSLAAGLTLKEILLNGTSKNDDVAGGGRHMSNHFAKVSIGIQNVSSCTGNHTLHAVGVARAIKTYKNDGIAFSSQGESSVSEGYVYEAINGASREKLPVIFVFQDNDYGIAVPKSDQTANERYGLNFTGFKNLKVIFCDGKDVFDSFRAMKEAVDFIKSGEGAAIVDAKCVRIGPHSNSDNHILYRSKEELSEAKTQDPLPKFRRQILEFVSQNELAEIEKENEKEFAEAETEVDQMLNPDPKSIFDFVFTDYTYEGNYPDGIQTEAKGKLRTVREAINEALFCEFRKNPDTFIWGQDVAYKEKGGIFNVTKGMQQEFGKERVFNAPICEDFIVGTANGFSRFSDKIRVVVEGAEFADYFWPAMEQLIELSHEFWRGKGQFSPNVTIRLASGGYIGGGLYHSQNLEGTFTTIPGLRIVVPAFACDAYGLLRTCIQSKGPSLYLEPKHLYNQIYAKAAFNEDFLVPFGKARVRKTGKDLTILTYGNAVHFSLSAAEKIQKESGKEVEVIDLRSLQPLDTETILSSVRKTGRCLIAHEDKVFGGFGGELAAIVSSEAFKFLDAPVERIGSTFTPVGFSRILEKATLPDENKVYEAAMSVLRY
ncbi:2-oxoisovalerate dehydrogenase [bacterium]|nr:2-oxoisovalerate dehydrogenase [bacterium]